MPTTATKPATGDCFSSAARLVTSGVLPSRAMLVHGIVIGTGGEMKGKPFAHAWVEVDDVVFDPSNGSVDATTKAEYYRIGQIGSTTVVRYSFLDTAEHLLEHNHFGPWDERFDAPDIH